MVTTESRESATSAPQELRRILLADDEPDILEISRIALETVGGYEVATCFSGRELLQLLPEFKPDLVVTDVVMPDMAGREVLDAMHRSAGFESVPIVFLTALERPDELEELRRAGAVEIIQKPFDPMTLAEKVADIWKGCRP
jgi:CheY-like chemotaxis protein